MDNHKKVQTFSWGGFAPRDPPFESAAVAASARQVRTLEPSRPLSRPPGVGSTWSMVWNVDYRTARSSPTRQADSGTFFLGPIPHFFSASFSPHFQEIQKIMSTQLTQHYFLHFQELLEIMSTKTQTWLSWRSQESQVWFFVDIISSSSWKCKK